MNFQVRIFLNNQQLSAKQISQLAIKSKQVDRIVNDCIDREPCTKMPCLTESPPVANH